MRVSVIIPVRNEEKHIGECIESVLAQTYPQIDMEILLIDGRSEDRTRQIIESFAQNHPYIKVLDNPHRIVPAALNVGIRASKGDIIIRMDAHTSYDKDYIRNCVKTLEKVDADNVGGPIVTLPGDSTAVAQAIALATSHPFGVGNSKFRTSRKAQYVDTITFGAFRKEIFDKIGLFNEKLIRNQDIELNSRIRRSGGRIFLTPEIKSFYYNQSTLKGLWRQNFRNGMWNIFTRAISRSSLSVRHFVPLLFVTSLLLSGIFAALHPEAVSLFVLVVVSYISANVFFTLRLGLKQSPKVVLLLPLVFFVMHFSYGLGSIVGILRLGHWKKAVMEN
jgi:glycosyltransferase involved in cell wall biosynthesis